MVSVSTPPRASPTAKPTGCPPPIAAKARLRRLPTKDLVIIETAEGRQREIAMPLRPRKTMISVLVRERPQPRTKPACKTQPTRYMSLAPSASAREPEINREQPLVSAWILEGHSNKEGGISNSLAIVGKATVVSPLRSVDIPVIRVTEAMITVVRDFEVTVSVRSRA